MEMLNNPELYICNKLFMELFTEYKYDDFRPQKSMRLYEKENCLKCIYSMVFDMTQFKYHNNIYKNEQITVDFLDNNQLKVFKEKNDGENNTIDDEEDITFHPKEQLIAKRSFDISFS